jgi:hypothetical protein
MIDYNEQYFYIKGNEQNKYPILEYDVSENNLMFMGEKFVSYPELIKLRNLVSVSKKYFMGDYHSLGYPEAVVSKKMKEVLQSFSLENVQFAPVLIEIKNEIFYDYYIFHVFNHIQCADLKKSIWEANDEDSNRVHCFEKLVIDNNKLDKIPLKKRLVFSVQELETEVLYHETVVEKLFEAGLLGFTSYRLSKWNPDAPFEEEYLNTVRNK